MKDIFKFIAVGFIFAIITEFQFNILALGNVGNFIFDLFFYPVFLIFVYFSNAVLGRIFKNKILSGVLFYLIFGIFGLAFEWYLMGNSPWANPDANQIGMFSFWVAVTFMPKIFIEREEKFNNLKKKIVFYFVPFSAITTVIGIVLPSDFRVFWLVWFAIIGYTFMQVFYIKYFMILKGRY